MFSLLFPGNPLRNLWGNVPHQRESSLDSYVDFTNTVNISAQAAY